MRSDLARALAEAFLSGEWSRQGLVGSGSLVVRRRTDWLPSLASEVLRVYPVAPLDRPRELAAVVGTSETAKRVPGVRPVSRVLCTTRMVRNPWHLPVLHDLDDLVERFDVARPELAWFADPKHWARRSAETPLQHYTATTGRAPSGSVRILEAPKRRLKTLQRRLLAELFGRIPPHDAAHGFRAGRSVGTYAAPHVGQEIVLRADLEGFFGSVTVGRVYGILRTAGYPEPVAHCLAGLVTTILPQRVWQNIPKPRNPDLLDAHWRLGRRLAVPHLPQGAPTSPAVANLAAYRLDARLAGLADSWGLRYTRYADDLAFSSGHRLDSAGARLLQLTRMIVREEGFRLNDRKTAVMASSERQQLGGVVVNERAHPPRDEMDRLRAVLHNCVRYGPESQNHTHHPDFSAHLAGRIAWVAQHNPERGAALRAKFDAIDWSEPHTIPDPSMRQT